VRGHGLLYLFREGRATGATDRPPAPRSERRARPLGTVAASIALVQCSCRTPSQVASAWLVAAGGRGWRGRASTPARLAVRPHRPGGGTGQRVGRRCAHSRQQFPDAAHRRLFCRRLGLLKRRVSFRRVDSGHDGGRVLSIRSPRMLRSGRRAMVMQVDIYGDGGGELAATATVNFAVINGTTPTAGLRADS
jgi:hypothetical protein